MASNLRILHLRDFIKFDAKGNLNIENFKEVFKEIESVEGAFTNYDVLINTRGAESHLSVFDIYEISGDLANIVHSGSTKGFRAKIAILCPEKRFDYAKFFELCAQNQGLNMRAFISLEEVLEWLSESSASKKE